MWNTRYYCWHYYQPSFALSPSPYRNVYELDAAERLMNEANRREKRKTYFTLFLCRRLFFFVFSTRTILRAQRQIVTWFFFFSVQTIHTRSWKCRSEFHYSLCPLFIALSIVGSSFLVLEFSYIVRQNNLIIEYFIKWNLRWQNSSKINQIPFGRNGFIVCVNKRARFWNIQCNK